MDPPTPWTYNPHGRVEWPLSCLHSECHWSPLPTPYPHISLCRWTSLGYYPEPIPSRTSHPSRNMWTQGTRPDSAWGCSHGGLPGGLTDGWEWHGAQDKAPHTSPPILQVTTNEPQTPDTGHKKNENQALAYGQVKPPPPDIGTLTYWHTCRELPQQPISPGTWWTTPVSPYTPRYQCAENRKVRYWCYTKK